MKKVLLFILVCLMALPTFAAKKRDIKMASFRQDAFGSTATIALQNCTDSTIYRVEGRITYYDMKGEMLDYKDINERVEIAPKMTKSIEIAPYGSSDFYYYYKSEPAYSHKDRKFKVKWDLTDYSLNASATDVNRTDDSVLQGKIVADEEQQAEDDAFFVKVLGYGLSLAVIVWILVALVALLFYIVIPARMARNRGRNPWLWVLISIVITPIFSIIILAAIGGEFDRED